MLRLRDSARNDSSILDERRVASWTAIIDSMESLWQLERMGDRIRLLFASTPEIATQNANALEHLRRAYRERRAALKRRIRR